MSPLGSRSAQRGTPDRETPGRRVPPGRWDPVLRIGRATPFLS